VRSSPPLIGLVIGVFAQAPRRRVLENLRLVRGRRGRLRDAIDVMRTFSAYASCLAETLSAGSAQARMSRVVARGEEHMDEALRAGRGMVVVTAHTAGWEVVGSSLFRRAGVPVMIVEEEESDPATAGIQDAARRAQGVAVAHVGGDPLAALPLVRHLRSGGIVALQIDRVRPGMRAASVRMFGMPALVPVGPAMLSMLTGAPMVPIFASRVGFRSYEVDIAAPVRLARGASEEQVAGAMGYAAGALEAFVRDHPTQWFHFRSE
jgi:KDO2-lipid IV(A) lauroyltransferase